MEAFLRMIVNGLETGSFYALAALGIIIIFRTSFTTNFAQGVIGMINAYIASELFMQLKVPTVWAFILAIISALIIGVFIDVVIIRNAKKVDVLGKQIITLGLIMIIVGIPPLAFGPTLRNPEKLIPSVHTFNIGPLVVEYNQIFSIFLAVILMVAVFTTLQYTKWGLAVRVTASNEYTAKLMGVPTKVVTMVIWSIAAALSAIAALLLAPSNQLTPEYMTSVQINALVACVLGGFQTFYGPVVASFIIGVLLNLIKFYISDVWADPLFYTFILLFILFRPYGIFGKKFVKKV